MNVLMKVKDMYDESDDVLMKRKEENEKFGLKLNIQKTKFMAPKSLKMVTEAMKLKDTCSIEGKL